MLAVIYGLVVLLLVLANGFFVAAEFALVGVRRSRIETLAATGDRRARRVLRVLGNLNAYLSASQLGITLASLALGWIGEPFFAHLLEAPLAGRVSDTALHAISFGVAFTIITALHIVLGEQAPKLLGLQRAERVALWTAWPMEMFYKVFQWPIRALDWAASRAVRPFGLYADAGHASVLTEEELRRVVDISHKAGQLEAGGQQLINRVLDFSAAEVREAMVPRTNVVALDAGATLEETKRAFRDSGYSRLPVYRERLDDILGVLVRRDIEPYLEQPHADDFRVEKLLRAPVFVPATARLGAVLAEMQAKKAHLAFAVDEHGGVEGIVTIEDLLEEIVGEINDEFDEEVRSQITEEPDGTYLLDGRLAVRDANRRFKLQLPEEGGYTTVAGFLLARAGRLLRAGESVEYQGATFTVVRTGARSIRRVRFKPAPAPVDGGGPAARASLVTLLCALPTIA